MTDRRAQKIIDLIRRARAEQYRLDAAARGEADFRRPAPVQARSQKNSDAERARQQLLAGELRPWENDDLDPAIEASYFELLRREYMRQQYPVESLDSHEQGLLDRYWKRLVEAINQLTNVELSTLDTSAIGGVVPVHSTGSSRIVSLRRFEDGSSQLLVSHQFITVVLLLSTLARWDLPKIVTRLAAGTSGTSKQTGPSRELHAAMARCAMVRDLLLQLNFHGIAACYRPRLSFSASDTFRSALTFAMAHEAAHLLIGERDSLPATDRSHLRPDGTIAESQWGPELAQDRLALRLCQHVALVTARRSVRRAGKNSASVSDRVLTGATISMIALHVMEAGFFVREPVVHGNSLDRLGSLMIEFDPLVSPIAFQSIKRLFPVVDTCLFMEPLPPEAWDLLRLLVRAKVIRSNETRQVADRLIRKAKDSDVILTSRAEYEHTYDFLVSMQGGTDIPNQRCLDLIRAQGREALPEVLRLLAVPSDGILGDSTQLSRLDVIRAVELSDRIHMPSGVDRTTYVHCWANVISACIRDDPHRDRIFYHLLERGEDLADEEY